MNGGQNSDLFHIVEDIRSIPGTIWSNVSPEEIILTRITGGLTNVLYKSSIESMRDDRSGDKNQLLVRVFGGVDGLLNRPVENVIFSELSSQGVSPKLIATYPWGRLEEFLWDREPLKSGTDMVSITPEVNMVSLLAYQLRKLHSIKLTTVTEDFASANVFDITSKWLNMAETKYSDIIRPHPSYPEAVPTIESLKLEFASVKTLCVDQVLVHPRIKRSNACSALLSNRLCHNDLLSGNLMYRSSDKSLRFIDFEYSGFNYAIADIANVFTAVCESIMLSGVMHDVAKNFPSPQIQLQFVSEYLDPTQVDDAEAVLLLIKTFAMVDELRWTIWGIIQSQQTAVDFDYCMYYNARFNGFLGYKRMVMEMLAKLEDRV